MTVFRRVFAVGLRALAAGGVILAGSASAQTGATVLVVANAASTDSVRIAEHFMRARSVPPAQVLQLPNLEATPPDEIDRPTFERLIAAPIARWLTTNAAQDRIHFIVLTRGIPLRINGSSGRTGTMSSVDSELALLYRRMAGAGVPLQGPLPNPYFLGDRPASDAAPFSHETVDMYLVTRLDGFTADDAIALVDRAAKAAKAGRFLLDERSSWFAKGNEWLRAAAERLRSAGLGDRVVLEQTSEVLTNQSSVLGYYSWGSNDPAIKVRRFGLQFEPGAIGAMFVSSDGRTFREPPEKWSIGVWNAKASYYAGTPQSLAGDLVREGITGTAGHVAEPFLDGTIRPDILFPAYVSGRTLAESFYLAMPYASWQTVIIGDPLCAPFETHPRPANAYDPGLDATTELPRWFSARRVKDAAVSGIRDDAVRLLVRAETKLAMTGDAAAAQALLEQATTLEPGYVRARTTLAGLYDAKGEWEKGIEQYRGILAREPQNVIALNNLAYSLAVRKEAPSEARPYAEKARTLAPANGAVADTLAWIYYLLGDQAQAMTATAAALKASPGVPDIRVHAAAIYQKAGRVEEARIELKTALDLAPDLATRPDVVSLREVLK